MLHKNKFSIIVNLIFVILISSSICQTMYTSLFMTEKLSLYIFVAVMSLTLIFFVMFSSKVSSIISAIVVCIMLIIGLVTILFYTGITKAENWWSNYSTWFIDAINGFNDTTSQSYTNLTLILLAFIITLFVYMFLIKFYNYYVLTLILFSVFFVQLQLNIFISEISFILFIFSFLLYYFFDILKRRSKESTYDVGNKLKYLVYIIPICVVVIIFSFSFPIKSTRSAMPWLDNKFDSGINSIIDYFSNKDLSKFDYFSIKATGFGSTDRLGGNIKLSKTHVMNVKSEYSNLYLKASSKAFYDGHNWYDDNKQLIPLGNSILTYTDSINSDSQEYINGNYMLTEMNKNDDIFKLSQAEIKYVNLKTKSLFIPVKSTALKFNDPISLFFDNEQMISGDVIQNKGFEYTVVYNNLMRNSEEFKTSIRKSYKGYYNDYYNRSVSENNIITVPKDDSVIILDKNLIESPSNETLNQSDLKNNIQIIPPENKKIKLYISGSLNIAQSEESIFMAATLKEKIDTIYRKYTQLPEIVTPRVHELAQELTKNIDNPYDKAKAIENYLSTKYPYTLQPGNPPRKKDFVDYFLFDGKKGYCTYYASAMTILLRCIDIPARYVEGYILPPETNKDGLFEVTNQQAHAWVEVYFEGFGWIPFEPTSPFVANMYDDNTISTTVSSNMLNSGYDEYMNMMQKYGNKGSSFNFATNDLALTTEEAKSNTLLLILIVVSSVMGLILLAFGILVLINIYKTYRILKKIRKYAPKSSVLIAYNYIIKVLSIQNIVYNPGETPSQFGIRVEKTFDFMSYSFTKTSFTKITSHYIKARYSEANILKNDQQDMLAFIDILINLTIEKIGKLKFVIARYVLGKF